MDSMTRLFENLDELETHVKEVLCEKEALDPRYNAMERRTLWKNGKPCGVFFHLRGPRLVQLYAVWSTEDQRILFYDGQGKRFAETVLLETISYHELTSTAA